MRVSYVITRACSLSAAIDVEPSSHSTRLMNRLRLCREAGAGRRVDHRTVWRCHRTHNSRGGLRLWKKIYMCVQEPQNRVNFLHSWNGSWFWRFWGTEIFKIRMYFYIDTLDINNIWALTVVWLVMRAMKLTHRLANYLPGTHILRWMTHRPSRIASESDIAIHFRGFKFSSE